MSGMYKRMGRKGFPDTCKVGFSLPDGIFPASRGQVPGNMTSFPKEYDIIFDKI